MSTADHHPAIVDIDAPATADELARFHDLQEQFSRSFRAIFNDPTAPRSVLIVPSLSLDREVLARISGVHHYEGRMLCLLLLLQDWLHQSVSGNLLLHCPSPELQQRSDRKT